MTNQQELINDFRTWANYTGKEIEAAWGEPVEDTDAIQENRLLRIIDEFARTLDIDFVQAEKTLMLLTYPVVDRSALTALGYTSEQVEEMTR